MTFEVKLEVGVESVGEDAVIAQGFELPSDDSNTYRQLAGQHVKPIKPAQQKPKPNVQGENGSPDRLSTSDHMEDIAEKEKVNGHDRH